MPRPANPVPTYRLHKSSRQAVVTLRLSDGRRRDILLGPYNSPESKAEYARVINEWQASDGRPPLRSGANPTVNEVLLAYFRYAERYYVDADGNATNEINNIRDALRSVRSLYGHTAAAEFGPLALKAVRRHMADNGITRPGCNARVNRIRRAFKWAASEELISFGTYQALTTVRGFGAGRGDAKETEPVRPVDPAVVEATLPFLPPAPAAMARLQLLTGMRPGEVTKMRAGEIDRTGMIWVYTPTRHKTAYRGRTRTVFLGPKAQVVLQPWLDRAGDGYIFSPARERDERYARLRAGRRSKVQPSQVSRKRACPEKLPGERYTTQSYACSIAAAVEKANRRRAVEPGMSPLPHWSPNRIRHTFATEVRKAFGLEAAGATLGHAKMSVTEVYAERDLSLALKVAAEMG